MSKIAHRCALFTGAILTALPMILLAAGEPDQAAVCREAQKSYFAVDPAYRIRSCKKSSCTDAPAGQKDCTASLRLGGGKILDMSLPFALDKGRWIAVSRPTNLANSSTVAPPPQKPRSNLRAILDEGKVTLTIAPGPNAESVEVAIQNVSQEELAIQVPAGITEFNFQTYQIAFTASDVIAVDLPVGSTRKVTFPQNPNARIVEGSITIRMSTTGKIEGSMAAGTTIETRTRAR